ncbi:MAG: hypothetical protein ACI97P_001871, partial [Arcticibacterium sp.]
MEATYIIILIRFILADKIKPIILKFCGIDYLQT